MNISCDVIRDLLPLYAEDMVSEDSKNLVREHLASCDKCMAELAELKKAEKIPVDTDTNALSRVKNTIRRKRVLTVLAVILTISSIFVSIFNFVTVPIYLPYEKAIEGVELREDGALVIDYSRAVTGHGSISAGDGNQFMLCQTTVYDYWKAKFQDKMLEDMNQMELDTYILNYYNIVKYHQRTEITEEERNRFYNIDKTYCFQNEIGQKMIFHGNQLPEDYQERFQMEGTFLPGEHDYKIVYVFRDGRGGSMILDEGDTELDWTMTEIDWKHDLYEETFYASILLSLLLWFWIRYKNPKYKELMYRFVFLFASIAFGILIASHGQFNYAGSRMCYSWWEIIITVATNVLLAACAWRSLYVVNQKDKAI